MYSLKDIELVNSNDTVDIISVLKRFGIVVIKGFAQNEEIDLLEREYDSLMYGEIKDGFIRHGHPSNEEGMVVRVNQAGLEKNCCNNIKNFFSSKIMHDIANNYFHPYKSTLNDEIFLTNERESDIEILPWHFDRIYSLKYFLSLTDMNAENGAFEYALGSHREGHYRANTGILGGTPVQRLLNDIPSDEILMPVTLETQKGDIIIFDSDGFHKGGFVKKGRERKIIRGHTHPCPKDKYGSPRIFSPLWFIQSPLNFSRLFIHSAERKVGITTKSKAKNRDNK